MIKVKRVYEEPQDQDGFRVLVDRLWPRGLSRQEAAVDLWMRDVAPSTELRKWFGHDPDKWDEFRRRYERELAGKQDEVGFLIRKSSEETLTLVYAARDEQHNNAVALRAYLVRVKEER